jgi:hypothetical protein
MDEILIEISEDVSQINRYIVKTHFCLGNVEDYRQSALFERLEAALHSLDLFGIIYYENYFYLDKDCVDLDSLITTLKRWKLSVKKVEKIEIIENDVKKENVKIKKKEDIKVDTTLPTILALDLKEYIKTGVLFKSNEKIVENSQTETTIFTAFNNVLDALITKEITAVLIPVRIFLSNFEFQNKILPKLPEAFKDKPILDFLSTRRTEDIINVYKSLTVEDKKKGVGEKTSNGFTFIDANRIYDIVYKFGTQSKKAFFIYKNLYIMKPYKWDYVILIDIIYLNSLRNNELISFSLLEH